MYIKGEQKEAMGKKRGGRAVARCPKYEGFFRLIQAPTDTPAAGLKYTIRSKKQIWEGVTDEKGDTEIIKTKRPTRVTLEISLVVIHLDPKGIEKSRTREKIIVAEAVTQCAPVKDPLAAASVGDWIYVTLRSSAFDGLQVWRATYVVATVKYNPSQQPAVLETTPLLGSAALMPDKANERIELLFSRKALLAVEEVIVAGQSSFEGDVRLAPVGDSEGGKEVVKLPVAAAKFCNDASACVLAYELEVQCRQILRKNILFVGSELHYDSFWWKMMFIAPAYRTAKSGGSARTADRTTIAYVAEGYTDLERQRLEALKPLIPGCEIVLLGSSADIINVMNEPHEAKVGKLTVQVKLQDVVFFCHGVASEIVMNYPKTDVSLHRGNVGSIRSDAFVTGGAIWSYACRTGISEDGSSFSNDAEAKPQASLAQKMATQLNVAVHAFLTRSNYRYVLRDPADSARISAALKAQREAHALGEIDLIDDLSALPHPGLADSRGPRNEGTDGFALWRKSGARAMPISHETPKGLTQGLITFKPGG